MAIGSVFYAAFGYLALLGAILWGMLFVGGDVSANMDAAATVAPLEAVWIDLGLLLLLALLHRSLRRGMLRRVAGRSIPRELERSTQAWAAAAVLALIYAAWQPLPQVLWSATGALQSALSALFYLAWTLILIGAFLASHLDLFEIGRGRRHVAAVDGRPSLIRVRQPLCWRNSHGGVGDVGNDRRAPAARSSGDGVPAVRRSVGGAQGR